MDTSPEAFLALLRGETAAPSRSVPARGTTDVPTDGLPFPPAAVEEPDVVVAWGPEGDFEVPPPPDEPWMEESLPPDLAHPSLFPERPSSASMPASRSPRSGGYDPAGGRPRPAVPSHLLEGLNGPQAKAVCSLDGPLMVVAGPGSGKTRVLTHRIAALVATGTWASRIMAVTFTNKAAEEMRTRLIHLLGEQDVRRMWVGTFHSICVRLLRQYGTFVGVVKDFSILDADASKRLIGKVALGMPKAPAGGADAGDLQSRISRSKNAAMTPSDVRFGISGNFLADVWSTYDAELARIGALDFDDLLLKTLVLLKTCPGVLKELNERFTHVLVDEYQDTNQVQYEITNLLAGPGHHVCVVGDGDQSIYAFRGATDAALGGFEEDHPGTQVIVLDQNYRSTGAVLEVAQAVIAPNEARHRAHLWTQNPAGEPVQLVAFGDDRDEASFVASQIKGLVSRGVRANQTAVLVRSNSQTRVLEEALRTARLPYALVGTVRFYDRAEVRDALAWLRVAANPLDEVSLLRATAAPKRGLGEAALSEATAAARAAGESALPNLRRRLAGEPSLPALTPRQRTAWSTMIALVDRVAAEAARGPEHGLKAVLAVTGLREHYAELQKKDVAGTDRLGNLEELLRAAQEFLTSDYVDADGKSVEEMEPAEQTREFLASVALTSSSDTPVRSDGSDPSGASGTPVEAVQVLTSHSAKGREFAHVFVVGVEDGLYPHSRSKADPQQVAEERRLLFVAVSRAMTGLTMSYAKRRMVNGRIQDSTASPFLGDLPDSVVRRDRAVQARTGFPTARTPGRTPSWGSSAGSRGAGGGSGTSRGGSPARSTTPTAAASSPRVATSRPGASSGPRVSEAQARAGVRVTHVTHGSGVIEALSAGDATVLFDSGKRMCLRLSLAPMSLAA